MKRPDWLIAGGLTAILLAFLLPLAPIGVDPHHDGVMFKPALDALSGQVIFRDSFTQYGLFSSYLQALALWIQPTLLAVRLLNVAAYAVTLVILYAAWRLILPRSLVVVSCALFILLIPAYERNYFDAEYWILLPWSSVFSMLFQSIGLYALFRVIQGQQPERWGLVLGMACACAFWCRQPVGLAMAASLLVIWPALLLTGWTPATSTRRAILGKLLGGFLVVNAIVFGGLALNGALSAWWEQNILWPARWSQGVYWRVTLPLIVHPAATIGMVALCVALVLPGLLQRFRPGPPAYFSPAYFLGFGAILIWQRAWLMNTLTVGPGGWHAFIPLVIFLQAGLSLRLAFAGPGPARPAEYHLIAAWTALALGSLLQYYPMADSWHAFYALSFGLGLLVFSLWRWSGWPATTLAAVLAVALLPSAWAKARAIPPALHRPLVTLTKPAFLRGMRVPEHQARNLGQIADLMESIMRYEPDIPSAMIGYNALYVCFTANHTNPTPYYVTWEHLVPEKDNRQRWRFIQAVRPVMILQQARWDAVNDFYRRSRYVPLLYLPDQALEIAVPQELADRMGLKAYGAARRTEAPAAAPVQP